MILCTFLVWALNKPRLNEIEPLQCIFTQVGAGIYAPTLSSALWSSPGHVGKSRQTLPWLILHQRILSWPWGSRMKLMSGGAVDAGASSTSRATACILWRVGSGASPCSALVRRCREQITWYHWEERGKGVTYIPDSWWVKQWVAEGRCDRSEAGWPAAASWPRVGGSTPGREIPGPLPASLGGKQLPMVLVSVTAECCSKGWSTVTRTDWALSHFLFHITPGKRESINETLEVNGARSRLKCVKNFSQEICLFGPFVPFHRHNLPGCMLFIFPWLSLFLFNP